MRGCKRRALTPVAVREITMRNDVFRRSRHDAVALMMQVLQYMRDVKLFPPGYDGSTACLVPHHGIHSPPVVLGSVKTGEAPQFFDMSAGVMVNDQHGMTLHGYDGSVTHLRLDGIMETIHPIFSSVAIEEFEPVRSHRILNVLGGTSHHIEFEGGGFLSYIVDIDGKVQESMERRLITSYCPIKKVLYLHGTAPQQEAPRA